MNNDDYDYTHDPEQFDVVIEAYEEQLKEELSKPQSESVKRKNEKLKDMIATLKILKDELS